MNPGDGLRSESPAISYFMLKEPLTSIRNADPERVQPGSLWSGRRNEELRKDDDETALVDWREGEFAELDPDEFELLRMVRKDADRMRIYRDPEWLSEARRLGVGDAVLIVSVNELEGVTGCIRFKGRPDADRPGVLFGIELDAEFSGKGTSDGTFRKRKFFSCAANCAVFYSVKCVRRYDYAEPSYRSLDLRSAGTMMLNERVVWISDDGPQYGRIRWLGELPELDCNPYAGVEFENPIGKGSGRYKGRQLFTCRKGHSSLVPLIGLILADDYDQRRAPDSGSMASRRTTSGVPDFETRMTATATSEGQTTLVLGDRVEVKVRSVSRFGVIRWIGRSASGMEVAGIEMDDEDPECYTSGSFEGDPKFKCHGHRAFFIGLEKCRPAAGQLTTKSCPPDCGSSPE